MRDNTTTDRGQAYTLEGFISAMIVLMALLFALQSIVITPTTGGLADRTVEAQMQQETQDALMIAATADEDKKNLSEMIRYWDHEDEEFQNADDNGQGDYQATSDSDSEFYDEFVLGEIMVDRFTESGMSYNVELVYWNGSQGEYESEDLVYQGESESVTASYTVTLYKNDSLTTDSNMNISDEDANYPIPPANDDEDAVIYNVVEVRISIW